MRYIHSFFVLLVGVGLSVIPLSAVAQSYEGVNTVINQATLVEENTLHLQGYIISPSDNEEETVFLQAVLTDKEGITRDQVVHPNAITPGSTYDVNFSFGINPIPSDTLVLMTVSKNGAPHDLDPIFLEWEAQAVELTRDEEMVNIIDCEYIAEDETLSCSYEGSVWPQEATVHLYDGQSMVKELAERSAPVAQEDNKLIFKAFAPQAQDGLYIYTITDTNGAVMYRGSVRTGELVIEPLDTQEQTSGLADFSDLILVLGALAVSFLVLIAMLVQWILNPHSSRWIWIGLGAIVLSLLSFWYATYAASYQSTNYPQFVYTVSAEAVDSGTDGAGNANTTYLISFSAFDNYTGTPPRRQRVNITTNGSTYQPLINSYSRESVHTREIVVRDTNKNSVAIQVVDGCGSYYGYSRGNSDSYGTYNCSPYPLEMPDAQHTGCTDPEASNYDPQATVSTETCQYTGCTNPEASNYNAQATIDDGTCQYTGCTDPEAFNYDPQATIDDGTCKQCFWTPTIPDLSTYCSSEVYYQTNSCTGDVRTQQGMLDSLWLPDLAPSDICAGKAITQTQQCSSLIVAPTRIIEGTSNDPFCFAPVTEFEVSTNLTNWSTCESIDRIKMTHPNQALYLRGSGTERADSWEISQEAGEISGSVSRYEGDVWKAQFDYLVEQKQFDNVAITMESPAGNQATQLCDLTLLSFNFEER